MYKIPILLGAISILAIIVSVVLLVKSTQTQEPILFSSDSVPASRSAVLTVDVEGAVVVPGIYSLPTGSRVEDAIIAAGGLGSDADTDIFAKTFNRATKLIDGAKLYVSANNETIVHIPDAAGALISVNSATESELDSLPGVGPVTAQKIIDTRPYQTLEELVSKKAVGPALFEKIKAQVSL